MKSQTGSAEAQLSILAELTGAVLGELGVDIDDIPDDARTVPYAVAKLRPFTGSDLARKAKLDSAIAFDNAVADYFNADTQDQAAAFTRVLNASKPFARQPKTVWS